jgi:flagellar hook protein FlgE
MSSTFSIALSGLKAQSEAIDTTGNNLANLNTTGFKGSAVDFKDLFSQTLGVAGSFQSGLGVSVPVTNQQFTQGSIQSSSSPLSTAIQGSGFFVVNSPNRQQLFTRDGNFVLDANGVLKTQTGETVQGWTATAAGLNTTGVPANISLPTGAVLPPKATQNFALNANLDAGTAASGSFSSPIAVVDSLGNTHNLTVKFTRIAAPPNTWNYDVTIPGADVGGAAGSQPSVLTGAPGSVTFKTDGTLDPASTTPVAALSITGLADGAAPLPINFNLFDSNSAGTITQYAEKSNLAGSTQDGTPPAQLTTVGIQNGGQVVASFSNGQQRVVAQLALASIENPNSLQSVGNNNMLPTSSTAIPAIGVPQTGGRGQILGGALEGSNVDIATQFTNLIVYQSAYQANSKVITTAQQLDQELFNLIH